MKKEREKNYEMLRIVAMLMIVSLHYLSKGGALADPKAEMNATGYTAWLLESFCLMSVNVYVLISGYFGVNSSGFRIGRPLRIYGQVWFYSVGIGIIALITGLAPFDWYHCMTYLFPFVTEHYWFATAYLLLCLMMPFLNAGAIKLEQRTFQWILAAMLLIFCIAKSILPMQLPWDYDGYDAFWFVFLYLTGAYLKLYKISGGTKWLWVYVISAILIFASMLIIRNIYLETGMLENFISYGYSYNYIFTYTGAVGLFLGFGKMGDRFGEHTGNIISTLAGATFGVYLIHEHTDLRYVWEEWFGCADFAHSSLGIFLVHMLITVLTVYLVCTGLELVRKKAVHMLMQIWLRQKV